MIKIALVEDHVIVLDGIKQMLQHYTNFELLWSAKTQSEAIRFLDLNLPNVLISDIHLPDGSGYQVAEYALKKSPDIKVIFLSMFFEPQYIHKALELGVTGYLSKDSSVEELVLAIDKVYGNENYFGQQIVSNFMKKQIQNKKPQIKDILSPRELEILDLLYQGLSTKEIADKLFLSEKTVANYKLSMMSKLNVTNTVQLVKMYMQYLEENKIV